MTAGGLFVWALVVHGATQIVTVSRLARPLRDELADLAEATRRSAETRLGRAFGRVLSFVSFMVRCPMCAGFWIGAVLGALGFDPVGFLGWPWLVRAALDGAAASAVAWGFHVVWSRLGAADL